jgi:flagellar biosynthesis protein FliP
MVTPHHHKAFIGFVAIVILIIGLVLGASLAVQLDSVSLEAVKISLMFTIIILLLITGGLVIEIKEILQSKKK